MSTWASSTPAPLAQRTASAVSNAILIYDVTDPTNPVLTDSVTTDARFVLDVKVNGDASLAVFSREGAATRANGIVLLDLSDPA
ncbi:MAG: hypothetical protein L0322_01920, partial [Chloroflexi bacterium]|nr:hypothetical protein [Chloroflexota bacterium]